MWIIDDFQGRGLLTAFRKLSVNQLFYLIALIALSIEYLENILLLFNCKILPCETIQVVILSYPVLGYFLASCFCLIIILVLINFQAVASARLYNIYVI